MSNRYVGHRYIPLFDGEWDKSKTYESLTFVHYQSKTYVSRQFVPTQIDIENNEFWAFFMEYTPQVFKPIFLGEWDNTKEYQPLSTVVNVDKSYLSKQFVPSGVDINNEAYWVDISTYYQNLLVDFENAEQERQSDEIIRVENENQRKIDHANRSAELDGKADKKQEDWITPTLLNGATSTSPNLLQYRKNEIGQIEFKGRVTVSSSSVFMNLPLGYRPSTAKIVTVKDNIPGRPNVGVFYIQQDGSCSIAYGSGTFLIDYIYSI